MGSLAKRVALSKAQPGFASDRVSHGDAPVGLVDVSIPRAKTIAAGGDLFVGGRNSGRRIDVPPRRLERRHDAYSGISLEKIERGHYVSATAQRGAGFHGPGDQRLRLSGVPSIL